MSKFLAPIHFWLFNKVKIQENLEREIESAFASKYGSEVENIVQSNIDKYGDRLKSDQLDEIIDESNIHGWLQHNISIAETRQAAILGDLFEKFGDEAFELSKDVFRKNASKYGLKAREDGPVKTPEDVYKTINNYVLDGMPCDSAGSVTESTDKKLVSKQENCLHINYWKQAGVDPEKMYALREEWIKAFVESLDSDFTYSVSRDQSNASTFTVERR